MHSKLVFFSFLLIFSSTNLFAQLLWNRQIPMYGSGDSEGTAYSEAEQNLSVEFASLQSMCKKQGGNFSSRMQRSFCDPYDPNTLFDPQTCLVIGYAYCQSEPVVVNETVVIQESEGNKNGAVEPGERTTISVTLRNSGQRVLSGLQLSLATSGDQPVIALKQSDLRLGTINPGESKTVSFEGTILTSVPCGARAALSFVARGSSFLYRFSSQLLVGKLAEKPIVLENKSASAPLTVKGVSYLMGEVTGSGKKVSQLLFSYNATVRVPSKYRLWINAPNGKAIWSYFVDESRTNISFSRDLTEDLKGGDTNGKWYLSGDMAHGNTAVIKDYKLVIVPNSFECEK